MLVAFSECIIDCILFEQTFIHTYEHSSSCMLNEETPATDCLKQLAESSGAERFFHPSLMWQLQIYIHTCICMYIQTYTLLNKWHGLHFYIHILKRTNVLSYIHTYAHTFIHTCGIHAYIRAIIQHTIKRATAGTDRDYSWSLGCFTFCLSANS